VGSDGHGRSHLYSCLEEFEKIIVEEYEGLNSAAPKAFRSNDEQYRYGKFSYINIAALCRDQVDKFKVELESEKYLLGQDMNIEVQCRLVYFFDN
jgi:hypothetical protein